MASTKKHAILFAIILAVSSCGEGGEFPETISINVNAGGRAISTFAAIIAKDQGLFEKHGLDVRLIMDPPDDPSGRETLSWFEDIQLRIERRLGLESARTDIGFNGGSPQMLRSIETSPDPHPINIGSNDCAVRMHLIGRKGLEIQGLEDLRGLRLGASLRATSGFQALLFARRMGWDPSRDFEFVQSPTDSFDDLDNDVIDVLFANERTYARAVEQGYPILFDLAEWNEEVPGNSITVAPEWLDDPLNREAARRFLMAIGEALSIYHQDRELTLSIMAEWNALRGEYAERIYERGLFLPRKPFPCVEGYRTGLELYAAPELQALGLDIPGVGEHAPEEFYDDSIVREIDESGFLTLSTAKFGSPTLRRSAHLFPSAWEDWRFPLGLPNHGPGEAQGFSCLNSGLLRI